MYLCGGQSMAVVTVVMSIRQTSAFVAPVRSAFRQAAGGVNSRSRVPTVGCWMSTAGAATPARANTPIINTDSAELKAERLWGMPDAQKPPSVGVESSEEAENAIREGSQKHLLLGGLREGDNLVREEEELTALRRYEYSKLVGDDSVDDGKEYYI